MPETALGFDPDFAMAYGAQPQHKNDGLPWLVDDRGAGGGSKGLKEFIAAEAERGQGPGRVHLPADVIGTVQRNGDRWECAFVFQGQQCLGTGDTRDGAIMAAAKYVTGKTTE